MSDSRRDRRPGLNESQERRLLSNFQHADKLLSEIEGVLASGTSKAAFPKYVPDFTPAQARMVESYIARLRSQILRVLESVGVAAATPTTGGIHSIRVHLAFIRIAIQESTPDHLRGYGPVPPELIAELEGLTVELERIVAALDAALAEAPGNNLTDRLAGIAGSGAEAESLDILHGIIERYGLVELRPALSTLVDRLAHPRFEIAFFGQVSSGKSSLLNRMIGEDLLPVGVNPVTAVPTRLAYSATPGLTVLFADRQVKRFPLEALPDFVTEERNGGNFKSVARIQAGVASERLRDGVVLVDTPGLGSLATSGAAETRAYLPQCDLGVVLINAGSAIGPEDVATVRSLHQAGVRTSVLLSKADLLSPADRGKAAAYIGAQLEAELGVNLGVHPISVMPSEGALLNGWFEEQIVPVYSRHKELALESVRRKLAVLREGAARSLEARLGRRQAFTAAQLGAIERADQELRAAAGALPAQDRNAMDAADAVRRLTPAALDAAAQDLVRMWGSGGGEDVEAVTRAAISRVVAAHVAQIYREFDALVAQLAEALQLGAGALGMQDPLAEVELRAALRNLPQPDLSQVRFEASRPWYMGLSRGAAVRGIRRRLWGTIGGATEEALIAYSRLLRNWVQGAVGKVKDVFDSQADEYRAQFTRLLRPGANGTEKREQLEEDLEWLRTGGDAGCSHRMMSIPGTTGSRSR